MLCLHPCSSLTRLQNPALSQHLPNFPARNLFKSHVFSFFAGESSVANGRIPALSPTAVDKITRAAYTNILSTKKVACRRPSRLSAWRRAAPG